jgi:hypothetical protein
MSFKDQISKLTCSEDSSGGIFTHTTLDLLKSWSYELLILSISMESLTFWEMIQFNYWAAFIIFDTDNLCQLKN